VQEAMASKSMQDCHVACVLTNSLFTPAAIELAKKNLVILWDRTKLQKFIEKAES
jgi:HJR/Mrr/RecB family endonuclease